MCNLLIAVFRGKFAEAIDFIGEKEKLEIPGGWGGVQRPSGTEIPGGWGVWIFSGTAHCKFS